MAYTVLAQPLPALGPQTKLLKQLSPRQSTLFFGLPALGFWLAFYVDLPWLLSTGLPPFRSFAVTVTVPAAILMALALGFYKHEGYALTWAALAERFRIKPLSRQDWFWVGGGLAVSFLGGGVLGPTARMLIDAFPFIGPPGFFPAILNPNTLLSAQVFADYIGEPVRGNWSLVVLQVIVLFFNILGEEFWWRGLILPRQERTHGRATWLVHGILWTLFHLPFYPWQLFALLPVCLSLSYVCQKTGNTTTGIVIHALYNGTSLVLILLAVIGIIG